MSNYFELAEELGRSYGKSAASWVFDGNTSQETYKRCIELDEEGDPEFYDYFGSPDPLFGEYSDGRTEQDILIELGVIADDDNVHSDHQEQWDAILTAFEDGYHAAHYDEVMRVANKETENVHARNV
jgi:hypothetical protein